tara:strand:- start:316 stop:510 length:195 start_codon:yes stop_codon:yes gene_type:complete
MSVLLFNAAYFPFRRVTNIFFTSLHGPTLAAISSKNTLRTPNVLRDPCLAYDRNGFPLLKSFHE